MSAPKRIKMQQTTQSGDTLDESEQEIGTKVSEATEFIDLPIENPKAEPEYVEETQEIETEQDEDQYVEDVTYGEESYFTEGDEKAAGVSGFSETYVEGDQTATEAQG
jgi:predicted ribosome quality control (RQC) complex YloA/Tae2 family protein